MVKNRSKSNSSTPTYVKIIGINLLIGTIAGIVDQIFYQKFLYQNGYNLKEIIVPWRLIVEYHSSGIGLLMFIVIVAVFLSMVITLWGAIS